MKQDFRQLVSGSKTTGRLNPQKIKQVASHLKRSELREYLRLLKIARDQEKVVIEIPIDPSRMGRDFIDFFKKRFRDKEIEVIKNPALVAGLRLKVQDNVLDLSFRGILERFYKESL